VLDARRERALLELTTAEAGLRKADMLLVAAAARRRRGEWIGGDEGAMFIAEADAQMKTQEIMNPEKMTEMLVPGGKA
jgi:hypothetical protein